MPAEPRSGPARQRPRRTWPALTIAGADLEAPDDLIQATLLDHDVASLEETGRGWRVFFVTASGRDAAAAHLRSQFPHLNLEPADVADEDWAARSQASLHAVRIGTLTVAPPWDPAAREPSAESSRVAGEVIVIRPSMGFGTGHHATTRLCLAALQRLDLRGRSLIDVGTGSGVLAIAASLLGAREAVGFDDDPDALQAANENLALNPRARVVFEQRDLRHGTHTPADVVTANLTGGLLTAAAAQLMQLTGAGGQLILSGFVQAEEPEVLGAFRGCLLEDRHQEDEWVCIRMRRAALL